MRNSLWLVVALQVDPAFADDTPISTRVGARLGIEGSSTVRVENDQTSFASLMMLGVDVDSFSERFFMGGGVSLAGEVLGHGAYRGSLHVGIDAPTTSLRATARVELGAQWLVGLCPAIFRTEPCGETVLPFAGLRGELGYAGEHANVALWGAFLVDLGRDEVISGSRYDVGGITFGGGLTFAYAWRGR